MIRTFPLDHTNDIAYELIHSGLVLVQQHEQVRLARELLRRCDILLRSNAKSAPLEAKTMFPAQLAKVPHSQRHVFQFFEVGREPPAGVSQDILEMVVEVRRHATASSIALINAFAGMDHLSPEQARQLVDPAEWVLNAVHYPGLPGLNGQIRFPAHRDWGLLAGYPAIEGLGFQAQVDGKWITIEPPPGTMLVYAGQTLTMMSWSNIPALSHRVIQLSEYGRSALIHYADAPRHVLLPDGRTVGSYIDGMLAKIGQTAGLQA